MGATTNQSTLAWKRNKRCGPLDWWLACEQHGDQWMPHCMSCDIAIMHNREFQLKLQRETAPPALKCAPTCETGIEIAPSEAVQWNHRPTT